MHTVVVIVVVVVVVVAIVHVLCIVVYDCMNLTIIYVISCQLHATPCNMCYKGGHTLRNIVACNSYATLLLATFLRTHAHSTCCMQAFYFN